MTTATTAAVADDEQHGSLRRPRRRRALLLLLLLLAAAVVGGGGAWWWSHPSAFEEPGNSMSISIEPGEPIYLGMVHPPTDVSLDLVDAAPRVVFDQGDAQLTVHVCRLANHPYNAVGIVGTEDLQRICESLRAPSGPLEENDQLVVEVLADASGIVVGDGLDVTYRTGLQRGTQATGVEFAVIVVEPGSTT